MDVGTNWCPTVCHVHGGSPSDLHLGVVLYVIRFVVRTTQSSLSSYYMGAKNEIVPSPSVLLVLATVLHSVIAYVGQCYHTT